SRLSRYGTARWLTSLTEASCAVCTPHTGKLGEQIEIVRIFFCSGYSAHRRAPRLAAATLVAMTDAPQRHADDLREALRLAVCATSEVTEIVEAMHCRIASGAAVLGQPLAVPARIITKLAY